MIRRISLFGGSGIGKSTLAAYVFYTMKMRGYSIELIQEYIKTWAYQGKRKISFDEIYIFAQQLYREDSLLQTGLKLLVTDSPVHLQIFYSDLVRHPTVEGQLQIANAFEQKYPALNILLKREGIPFNPEGRYEKTEAEAIELDNNLKAFLQKINLPFVEVPSNNGEQLMSEIYKALLP